MTDWLDYHFSSTCLVSILVLVAGGMQTSLGLFSTTFWQSLNGTGWHELKEKKDKLGENGLNIGIRILIFGLLGENVLHINGET